MKKLVLILSICFCSMLTYSQENSDTTVYCCPDNEALFPGGMYPFTVWMLDGFCKIKNNLSHNEIEEFSKTWITVTIEKNGMITNPKTIRGKEEFGKLLIKELNNCPLWIPAQNNGKIVRSTVTIPITICFQ
jgi:hypothetical protein